MELPAVIEMLSDALDRIDILEAEQRRLASRLKESDWRNMSLNLTLLHVTELLLRDLMTSDAFNPALLLLTLQHLAGDPDEEGYEPRAENEFVRYACRQLVHVILPVVRSHQRHAVAQGPVDEPSQGRRVSVLPGAGSPARAAMAAALNEVLLEKREYLLSNVAGFFHVQDVPPSRLH